MINFEEIRGKLIQQAIEGKLVPQLDSEEAVEQIGDAPEEIPFEVPEKWKWVKLNKLGKLSTGTTPKTSEKQNYGNEIPFIKPANINEKGVINYFGQGLSSSGASKARIVKANSVLMVCIGSVGKSGYSSRAIAFNQQINAIETNNFVNPKYIFFVFQSICFQNQAKQHSSATTLPILNKTKWGNLIVPLPPLEEQKRIVARLEALLTELDRAEQASKDLDTLSDQLKTSILQEAIQGKLVPQLDSEKAVEQIGDVPEEVPFDVPEKWKWVQCQAITDVRDGTHDTPKYYDSGIPFLTSKNLTPKGLDFTNIKYISIEDHVAFSQRSNVEKGDLLFAMIGTIGNPTIVETDIPFSIKNMALIKHRDTNLVDFKFLRFYLLASDKFIKTNSAGGVQKFISLRKLRELPFSLPPLEEQKRIVERVEYLFKQVDALKNAR